MDDLISRQAAIDALKYKTDYLTSAYICNGHTFLYKESALEQISALPPVQPKHGKRGRWLKDGDVHYCSECGVGLIEFGQDGEPIYFVEGYNSANHERCITTPGWCSYYMQFCPHCGADMRGAADD